MIAAGDQYLAALRSNEKDKDVISGRQRKSKSHSEEIGES